MAFTGVAVVTSLSQNVVRITGLSLAKGASGTIGLPGDGGANVELPAASAGVNAAFPAAPDGQAVAQGKSMSDLVEVDVLPAAAVAHAALLHVTKGGNPFRITITNDDSANATENKEIYVTYNHSLLR